MSPLPHCLYRRVDADGAVLCDRIKQGDREVNPDLCRACPVAAINCALLRATLSLHSRPPIRVRYGNGRTDIWAGEDPTLTLDQAACSVQVIPISSPHECSGCHLRQSLSHTPLAAPRPRVAPIRAPQDAPPLPAARSTRRVRPTIQLVPYLEKARPAAHAAPPVSVTPFSQHSPSTHSPAVEERPVGWTD